MSPPNPVSRANVAAMTESKRPPRDLREACLAEALAVIASDGVEKLSLREVARRLGVSHQAPYKHFPSRDHILAGVVARAFADFAAFLDTHVPGGDPEAELEAMGQAYLDYAKAHPLEYRLMFGTPLPDAEAHPEMMGQARHAFALLSAGLKRKATARGLTLTDEQAMMDAMFIWSGLHGFAAISTSAILGPLGFEPRHMEAARAHLFSAIGKALVPDTPQS